MEEAVKIIKEVIKKNKSTKDECLVAFREFGDFSLKIMVIYWIKEKERILEAQHEIHMELKRRFEKAKIEFAYPTHTIEFAKKKRGK